MVVGNRPDITIAITRDGAMLVAQGSAQDDERIRTAEAVESGLYYSQLAHRVAVLDGGKYLIQYPSECPWLFAKAYTFKPPRKALGGGKCVEVGRAPPKSPQP